MQEELSAYRLDRLSDVENLSSVLKSAFDHHGYGEVWVSAHTDLTEGNRALKTGDWVEGIRNLTWAHDVEPDSVEIYLVLIEAYERCAEAESEPDVLQQAFNVCRELRDRQLAMTPEQGHRFYAAFVRVREGIISAARAGWTPPPPKEQVHTLFPKRDGER